MSLFYRISSREIHTTLGQRFALLGTHLPLPAVPINSLGVAGYQEAQIDHLTANVIGRVTSRVDSFCALDDDMMDRFNRLKELGKNVMETLTHFVHLSRGQNAPNSLNKSGPLLGGHSSSVIQTRVSATVYLSSNSKRSPCQSVLNREIFAVSCRSLAILNNVALARSLEVTVPINLFPVMVKYPSGIASINDR